MDSLFNYAELTKDIDPSLVMKPDIEFQPEYEKTYLLEKEKEVFGFYLSSHPATMYKKNNPTCIPLNIVDKYFNKTIDTIILVDKIKVINTKKGDKMAFITGSDETSTMEYTLFPKIYNQYSNIQRGDLLKIRGNVERRLDQIQIIVDKIKKLISYTSIITKNMGKFWDMCFLIKFLLSVILFWIKSLNDYLSAMVSRPKWSIRFRLHSPGFPKHKL